jgi:ABC-2 type transport system ATP-binding protein
VAVFSTTLRLPWARRAERRKQEAVDQVIAAFGLERFRYHRTAQLSTGTRRVVDLASIVLARPRLLLLDEPTASLDPDSADRIRQYLQDYAADSGATMLIASHNMVEVERLCHDLLIMRRGHIVDRGTPKGLIDRYGRQTLEEVFLDIARAESTAPAEIGARP